MMLQIISGLPGKSKMKNQWRQPNGFRIDHN